MKLRAFVPNGLTAIRFAAGPIIPVAYWFQTNPLGWVWGTDYRVAIFVFAVAMAVTDLIDGPSARWLKCQSTFGQKFDPAADAIFCLGCAVSLLIDGGVTWYAFVAYWAPMAATTWYTIVVSAMRVKGLVKMPNREARIAIGCMMCAGCMFAGRFAFDQPGMEAGGVGLMLAGLLFEWRSLQVYREQSREPRTNNLAPVATLPARPT